MLFLTLLCLFCAVVSAKRSAKKEVVSSVDPAASSDVKVDILKAVVYNLPEECKKLNTMGSFDALSAKKYECMFVTEEKEFKARRPAAILALLMQRGDVDLVEGIARIWVEKRRWGPFNQAEIAADLDAILSPWKIVKFNKAGGKIEIDDESIYQVFKVMLNAGEGLIVADSVYLDIIPRALNMSYFIDKTEGNLAESFNLIMETFFIQDLPVKSAKKNAEVDVKLLARVYSMTRALNMMAEKGLIYSYWNVYASVICTELNSRFSTNFVLTEKPKKVKKVYESSLSEDSSEDDEVSNINSSSSSEDAFVAKKTDSFSDNIAPAVRTEPLMFIEIIEENASDNLQTFHITRREKTKYDVVSVSSEQPAIKALKVESEEGSSMNVLFIIGGSVLVLAGVGFVAYSLMNKRQLRKSSTNSYLA